MKVYLSNVKNFTSIQTGLTFISGTFSKFRNNEFAKNGKVNFVIYKPEIVEEVFKKWSDNNEALFDFDMETIEFTWRKYPSKQNPGVDLWNLSIIFNDLKSGGSKAQDEAVDISELDIWK